MSILAAALAASVLLQGGWTWTLYEGDGPLVLANEIPDTPELRATVECAPGSGVARLNLYGPQTGVGVASLSSGSAAATTEATAAGDHRTVALRADHPIFGQFVVNGALSIAVAGQVHTVEVQPAHLAKLQRFAELCSG